MIKIKKEVVTLNEPIVVDPSKFVRETLTLEEFKEQFKKYPSIGFDAFQALYASVTMFGFTEKAHNVKRPNFLDDMVDMPGKRAGEKA